MRGNRKQGGDDMSLWVAIALTLLASAAMNLGLVLQKKGLSESVNPSLDPRGARFRPAREWYAGLILLIGGYVVYSVAVGARAAPISLLQPLFASGVLVVALLAVVYLHERLAGLEWLGVAILLAGVLLLGASAEENAAFRESIAAQRLAAFLIAIAVVAGVVVFALRRAATAGRVEFLLGVLTGLLLGTGYLHTKILMVAVHHANIGIALLAGALMAVGLAGGLVMLQMAFRRGRALVVTAVNLVTNQVLVVCGGLFCLGESLPKDPLLFRARVAGLGGIPLGIVLLARLSAPRNPRTRGLSAPRQSKPPTSPPSRFGSDQTITNGRRV